MDALVRVAHRCDLDCLRRANHAIEGFQICAAVQVGFRHAARLRLCLLLGQHGSGCREEQIPSIAQHRVCVHILIDATRESKAVVRAAEERIHRLAEQTFINVRALSATDEVATLSECNALSFTCVQKIKVRIEYSIQIGEFDHAELSVFQVTILERCVIVIKFQKVSQAEIGCDVKCSVSGGKDHRPRAVIVKGVELIKISLLAEDPHGIRAEVLAI